jgi:hypothetical protein
VGRSWDLGTGDRLGALAIEDDPQSAVLDVTAAAVPVAEAARTLDRLAHANLLAEHTTGRYVVHDLLRSFAQRLQDSEPEAAAAATTRLYRYYVSHVDAAARLLYPNMLRLDVPPSVTFADGTAALDWMDAERHCLVSAVGQAAARWESRSARLIADGMRGLNRAGFGGDSAPANGSRHPPSSPPAPACTVPEPRAAGHGDHAPVTPLGGIR